LERTFKIDEIQLEPSRRVRAKITIGRILDTIMDVEVMEVTTFGSHYAVIPEVTGQAWFCGKNKTWIDPSDSQKDRFIFR